MPPRPGSTSRQNTAPLYEYPIRHTQPTRKPGMYLSPKRKAAKKRRQRRLTIITIILAAVDAMYGGAKELAKEDEE